MRLASLITLIVLSLGVASYAIGVYSLLPLGTLVHPDMRATSRPIPLVSTHTYLARLWRLLWGPSSSRCNCGQGV